MCCKNNHSKHGSWQDITSHLNCMCAWERKNVEEKSMPLASFKSISQNLKKKKSKDTIQFN